MNISLEADKYALIAVARQSWQSQQQENSARTGEPLAPNPSDEQLINNSPPLSQQLQAIDAQEILLASISVNPDNKGDSVSNPDNVQNPDAVNNAAADNQNVNGSNTNANSNNNAGAVHDAFGRFNIVA